MNGSSRESHYVRLPLASVLAVGNSGGEYVFQRKGDLQSSMHSSQDDHNARHAVWMTSLHGSLTTSIHDHNARQHGRPQFTAVRTIIMHGSMDDLNSRQSGRPQCTAVRTTSMHGNQDDLNARQSGRPQRTAIRTASMHGSLDDLQHTGAFIWKTRVSIFMVESRCLLSVLMGLLLILHLHKARLLIL